jgi:hypothetical protein
MVKCHEILLALRKVVGMEVPQHGRVEAHDLVHLLARAALPDGHLAQELGQTAELLGVRAAPRVLRQAIRRLDGIRDLAHVAQHVVGRLRAEPVEQQEHAVPGHRVARVRHHPRCARTSSRALLDELEAAALHERDVVPLQLELEVEG